MVLEKTSAYQRKKERKKDRKKERKNKEKKDVGWTASCLDSWVDDCGTVWSLDYCSPGMFAQLELGLVHLMRRRQPVGFASGLDVAFHRRLFANVSEEDALCCKLGGKALCNIGAKKNCHRYNFEFALAHNYVVRIRCFY